MMIHGVLYYADEIFHARITLLACRHAFFDMLKSRLLTCAHLWPWAILPRHARHRHAYYIRHDEYDEADIIDFSGDTSLLSSS